jgi:hypothetical protein
MSVRKKNVPPVLVESIIELEVDLRNGAAGGLNSERGYVPITAEHLNGIAESCFRVYPITKICIAQLAE